MEICNFIPQVLKIKEKEIEKKVWEMWIAKLPWMDKNNYISYEEMLNTVKQQEIKEEMPVNGVYIDQVFF
jgi:ribosomal protein L20